MAEAVLLLGYCERSGHVVALQPWLCVLPREWFEAANEAIA